MPNRETRRYRISSRNATNSTSLIVYWNRSGWSLSFPVMRSMVVAVAGTPVSSPLCLLCLRGGHRAPFFRFGPGDVKKPVRHRVVERQLAHDLTDFFVHMLIEPLCLIGRHPFLHFIEKSKAQI